MQSSRVSWNKNLQTCTFNSFHSCLSCSIINFLGLPHKYMVYGFVGVILNHLISFHVVACDHAPQYGLFFYYASGYYKLARYSQSGFLSTKESVMFFLTCQCHLRHASAISGYYKLARYSQSGLPSTKKIRNLDF